MQAAIKNISAEVIVVDNKSTDGSQAYFANKFSSLHFIWNIENMGFGRANNLALQKATGDYVLFLNPDTILPENALDQCLAFFAANPACGACGVRMIDGGGKFLPESKRRFPKLYTSVLKLGGRKKSGYYDNRIAENAVGETEVLSGAFMLLSRTAIKATTGFDEDFFMYGEDIDLSYRLYKNGFKNFYLGEVTIIHFKGESTNKFSEKYFEDFYGAMQLFVEKHSNPLKTFFVKAGISVAQKLARAKAKDEEQITSKVVVEPSQFYILSEDLVLEKYVDDHFVNCTVSNISTLNIEKQLKEIQHNSPAEVKFLLLSLPYVSYVQAIDLLERSGQNFYCLFHQKNSRSIVGSNEKSSPGYFIAY